MKTKYICFGLFTLGYPSAVTSATSYGLTDVFDKTNFFDSFSFFTEDDPTHGYVDYQNARKADELSLAGYADNGVTIGVDSNAVVTAGRRGRASTRVESHQTWTHGLFVADIGRMPSSTCGVWAAYWLYGEPWPDTGEIDIIEGVNLDRHTTHTLHTGPGCSFQQGNCNAPGDGTKGCGNPVEKPSYGDGFNNLGGGVYALEWTSEAMKFWFFPRGQFPEDIARNSSTLNPAAWPSQYQTAVFTASGGCNIDQHFQNNRIVFNTALCGDWAGELFTSTPGCREKANTCEDYVANNPKAFENADWLIYSVKVFSTEGAPAVNANTAGKNGNSSKTWPRRGEELEEEDAEQALEVGTSSEKMRLGRQRRSWERRMQSSNSI